MTIIDIHDDTRDDISVQVCAESGLDRWLPDPTFTEHPARHCPAEPEAVWQAALDVTAEEIRTFAPLIALRGLPQRLLGPRSVATTSARSLLLDVFERRAMGAGR